MANGPSVGLLEFLRGVFPGGTAVELGDGPLLQQFQSGSAEEAEAAFAVLIRRHGPLVLRLCLQVVGDPHEAQDAFQATFLILARKAGSIRQDRSIAGWLFGVARRVASRARLDRSRRRTAEERRAAMTTRSVEMHESPELWTELHDEIARLPEKYRLPMVCCYFQGLTTEEAGRRLGWPAGTIKVRLWRAREILRRRLVRRGLAPAVSLLAESVPGADVSAALTTTTARAALGFAARNSIPGVLAPSAMVLAEAVLTAMGASKLKASVPFLVLFLVLAGGARALDGHTPAAKEPELILMPPQETKADAPQQSAIRIRVLKQNGQPTDQVYVTLWRAVDAAFQPPDRGILYEPFLWQDPGKGKTWDRFRNWSPHYPKPDPFEFDKLPAGEFRLTAMTYDPSSVPDPTPAGASDVLRLDGSKRQEVTVRLAGESAGSLTIRLVEAGSNRPLERAVLRLMRTATWTPKETKPDSLPIVHGHGSGNFFERTGKNGEVRYKHLAPGEYAVHVLGRRASAYGELDYEPLAKPVQVSVVPWQINRQIDIPLRGQPLAQEEIDKRWPFHVTGTVTGGAGRALPGVEITAYSGVGTLFQVARTVSGPDGKYTLRFSAGLAMAGGRQGGQAATIKAHRAGFYERNLSRQGNLLTADRPPTEEERQQYRGYAGFLVPRTSYTLDFQMLPGASIEGRIPK